MPIVSFFEPNINIEGIKTIAQDNKRRIINNLGLFPLNIKAASKAKIINKNVKVDYNSNYKYKIMIIGVDGNPVNGVEIKISINAKVKTYKTDSIL